MPKVTGSRKILTSFFDQFAKIADEAVKLGMNLELMDDVTLRKAQLNDAEALAELGKQTFYDTYHEHNTDANMGDYIANNFTISHLEYELTDNDIVFFVAELGTNIIGYLKLNRVNNAYIANVKAVEISRLYVDKAFQHLKIGKKLILAAENQAKIDGCSAIWLGVWQKNTHAIEIYKHLGFTIVGTTTFTLGLDEQLDFMMVKQL